MKDLIQLIFIILLGILLTASSVVEKKWNESKVPATMNNFHAQSFTHKSPPKISHPSLSLETVSSNIYRTVLAGTGAPGNSGDGGPATTAAIRASQFWLDSAGNIYFVDDVSRRLRKTTPGGTISFVGGTGASSTAGFSAAISAVQWYQPYAVTGDVGRTFLYISDQYFIWKYVFQSNIISVFAQSTVSGSGCTGDNGPASDATFRNPKGLWLTTSGDLYIADCDNNRIRKVVSGIITTVAGSGCNDAGGFAGDNSPAASPTVQLSHPRGVYMDTTGRLFIADTNNYRIRLVNTNNIITTFAGSGTATPLNGDNIPALTANINQPYDVKGDTAGNIYIADSGNCMIRLVDTNGIMSTIFGSGTNGFYMTGITPRLARISAARGIWLDGLANIYFTDYATIYRSIVVASSPTYQPSVSPNLFMQLVAGKSSTGFSGDGGQATSAELIVRQPFVDNNGNIYAPDGSTYRIRKIAPDGIITTFMGTGTTSTAGTAASLTSVNLVFPFAMVGDAAGSLMYISDSLYIWKYVVSTGIVSVFAHTPGSATKSWSGDGGPANAALLNNPLGLWLTTADNLYIADSNNNRIRKVSSGIISTVTGQTTGSFAGDGGAATLANIRLPSGVYMDTNGNLYIADTGNNRIRVITASNNIISTFAGTGGPATFNGDNLAATNANLNQPWDVKGDTLGNIYIGENANCLVRVVDPSGLMYVLFGVPGSCGFTFGLIVPPASSIKSIQGFWVDSLGTVYFSDFNSIHKSVLVSSPSSQPSGQPTFVPTQPTSQPTMIPTCQPSRQPFSHPTSSPSTQPTNYPTSQPSRLPSTQPSGQPSGFPTGRPTLQPASRPSNQPTNQPSSQPSQQPNSFPSVQPSVIPSLHPSSQPSSRPSVQPTSQPSRRPSSHPSSQPTCYPTSQPSSKPSTKPTKLPSSQPTCPPTGQPSSHPSTRPSSQPSIQPSRRPSTLPTGRPSSQPTGQPTRQPTTQPSNRPSSRPSVQPSCQPSSQPTAQPSVRPTNQPTGKPSRQPTTRPTCHPTSQPTIQPTSCPTSQPSSQPSSRPTRQPTVHPSNQPTVHPSSQPTMLPTSQPSRLPTTQPSAQPIGRPSSQPTNVPIGRPSTQPTSQPTNQPTGQPSFQPYSHPSSQPTCLPSDQPTSQPSIQPSAKPTAQPSRRPSNQPTSQPSSRPVSRPSSQPTSIPTNQPTGRPASNPSSQPSVQPSSQPTSRPSSQPTRTPSNQPTSQPVSKPSSQPSVQPSSRPTNQPSTRPTVQPSITPSSQPSAQPSRRPTTQPSAQPSTRPSTHPSSQPTLQPSTQPTSHPSSQPTTQPSQQPSSQPSLQPTRQPSAQPSLQPSSQPTCHPTMQPRAQPSTRPSIQPTAQPSNQPIAHPSGFPTSQPVSLPSSQPTVDPTNRPTVQPTQQPSRRPSSQPSRQPSTQPTVQPTSRPTVQPSSQPTKRPTSRPSAQPSVHSSHAPSSRPSVQPSSKPSSKPSMHPTSRPTGHPTISPSSQPSSLPSCQPSAPPTSQPTLQPTTEPSSQPTKRPTSPPTRLPSSQPSTIPSLQPSSQPSIQPTLQPTGHPSVRPSVQPSSRPSRQPSRQPTFVPSSQPTRNPTLAPSSQPSNQPTTSSSSFPTSQPSHCPSSQPIAIPSVQPTVQPTVLPSNQPSTQPSSSPSGKPSNKPTNQPTSLPSVQPSVQPSSQPASFPTSQPSGRPTSLPSTPPTCQPSVHPSSLPSSQPTMIPTNQPSRIPTGQPISLPTRVPSTQPSSKPTGQPFSVPSNRPTETPSHQPTSSPTNQPVSSPSSQPSSQPTTIPTTQPFGFPTSAPVATIYQTNGVLFLLGETSGGSKNNSTTHNYNDGILGTSYILFGRNFNHQSRFPFKISLIDSSSREFVSEIGESVEAGIRNDLTTRSTTIVGDINGDSYLDLMVGYPLASKCSVYLGNGVDDFSTLISIAGESFAIVGDPYDGGGFLGWSSIRIGDLNADGLDELIVSAISANIVYVIYGKREFTQKNIYVNQLQAVEGFKIIGSPDEINFGVALTLLHDFRKGSRADLAITAQTSFGGQNVIYILFGTAVFKRSIDVKIQQIMNNVSACLKIVTPAQSYAGFSVAGIGDINSDGYDDLAVGSVPYNRGRYTEQLTYVIYGRNIGIKNSNNELRLANMTIDDGFIITGGGFLVTGVGDVNYDSVNDMMITSYYGWKGQSCAYVITSPPNMTFSPSLQPSSQPTAAPIITYLPSSVRNTSADNSSSVVINDNSSAIPSVVPTFRPSSREPTLKPSGSIESPSNVVYAVGTARPTLGKPSLEPTVTPTGGYHHLRGGGFSPTTPPSLMPTINATTDYIETVCSDAGDYQGTNETNYKFTVRASQGTINILGNDAGEAKNLYVLYCPSGQVNVVIKNFRLSTDIINVAHLSEAGFSYFALKDITYFSKEGLLTLLFCEKNKLQVLLTTFNSQFQLQESNFLFSPSLNDEKRNNKKDKDSMASAQIEIGIVFAVLCLFCWFIYVNRTRDDKNTPESTSYITKEDEEFVPRSTSDHQQPTDRNRFLPVPPSGPDTVLSAKPSHRLRLISEESSFSKVSSDHESDSLFSNSFIGSSAHAEEKEVVSFGSTFMALLDNDSDGKGGLSDDDGTINSSEFDSDDEEEEEFADDSGSNSSELVLSGEEISSHEEQE
jgi:sugar lactone lactonase YvrE